MERIKKEFVPAFGCSLVVSGIIWYFSDISILVLVPFFLLGWMLGCLENDQ